MKLFKSHHNQRGQSLVEMAIAAPVLIIFLLGIFEVGSAVRNYLTLVNVNREITRFAVRPGYLDFSSQASVAESYNSVMEWATNAVSAQLDLDFTNTGDVNNTGNTTLIISHLVVDTGQPCTQEAIDHGDCDCDAFVDNPASMIPYTYTMDDLILHPGMGGQAYQTQTFGPPETVTGVKETHLDYDAMVDELAAQNNKFNCEIIKKEGIPSANNVIVTELFYDQPQMFGFPFISNPYTDPVPLYTHTSMRLTQGARNITYNTTGYYCDAFPLIVYKDTIDYPNPNSIYLNQKVDIFNGKADVPPPPGANDMGWLAWNPEMTGGHQSDVYLSNSLTSSFTPMNDYTNAHVDTDHSLSAGDWVASLTGDKAAVNASGDYLANLMKYERFRIPVWDTWDAGDGHVTPSAYHIIGFAWVRIESVGDIDLPGKTVIARYLGDAKDDCQDNVPPPPPPSGDPPIAVDDTVDAVKDGDDVIIPVLDNDSDPNGDTLTITKVVWDSGGIAQGSWSHNGTTITYTPGSSPGNYKLEYTITDGNGNFVTAKVTIKVNSH